MCACSIAKKDLVDVEVLSGPAYRQISENSILVCPGDVRVGKEVGNRRRWRTTKENQESKNATTAWSDVIYSKDYDMKLLALAEVPTWIKPAWPDFIHLTSSEEVNRRRR